MGGGGFEWGEGPFTPLLHTGPFVTGKTFISYYCMKKVLRTSDDGLVIFCAPNKQLAHQVKADVYAHFRFAYPVPSPLPCPQGVMNCMIADYGVYFDRNDGFAKPLSV